MFIVENHYKGYRIKLSHPGTGTRALCVTAGSLIEVHKALDHYYVNSPRSCGGDCPLCREQDKRARRRPGKRGAR